MRWLSKLFTGIQQAEFYKARLAEAVAAKEAAESALFDEMRRNRLREDKLNAKILELGGAPVKLPERAGTEDKRRPDEPIQGVLDLDVEAAETQRTFEDDVEHRAQEFIRAAEESGRPYTPEEVEALYVKIRANPNTYLV